jgi:hypothetical protein
MNRITAPLAAAALVACSDVEEDDDHGHDHDHNHGLITQVDLTFTSEGDEVTATWAEGHDGEAPQIDDISLTEGEAYDLSVAFWNTLEDTAEEITNEVQAEDNEHQAFFTGDAVNSDATGTTDGLLDIEYVDEDDNGFPVGILNTADAVNAGEGTLTFTLRHLAPQDGNPSKTADLAETVAEEGFGSIPGDNDVVIDYNVEVN